MAVRKWVQSGMLVAALLLGLMAPAAAEAPRVELLTIGPGDALFNRWGHTAIRIVDRERGRDWVYNYGAAPFTEPGFGWDFLRGRAFFLLDVEPWFAFYAYYTGEDRTIVSQRLNLSAAQTEGLVDFLEWNSRRENRDYRYDHHRDNCATRVRDVLDEVTDGALRRVVDRWPAGPTYYELTMRAAAGNLLHMLVLDVISGPNQAVRASGWDLLYLPAPLHDAVAAAVADPWEGIGLAGPSTILYQRQGPPPQHGSPWAGRRVSMAFGLLVGLALVGAGWIGRRRGLGPRVVARVGGGLLVLVGLLFGVLGTAMWALGIVSVIPDTHWNENVAVFWPTDFVWAGAGVVWLWRGRVEAGRLVRGYAALKLGWLAVYALLKAGGVFVQHNGALVICAALVAGGVLLLPRRQTAVAAVDRERTAQAQEIGPAAVNELEAGLG